VRQSGKGPTDLRRVLDFRKSVQLYTVVGAGIDADAAHAQLRQGANEAAFAASHIERVFERRRS
jgi:hypothetical protein